MGPEIAAALADPLTQEIMVNPDGVLRLDRLGEGRVDSGVRIEAPQVERIIRLVASHARAEIHGDNPVISAALPPHAAGRAGARFQGGLPPVSIAPVRTRVVYGRRVSVRVVSVGRVLINKTQNR